MQGQNQKLLVEGEHKAGWVTISTDEYESLLATLEILSSPKAMEIIRKGEQDLLNGRSKPLDQLKKELEIPSGRESKLCL